MRSQQRRAAHRTALITGGTQGIGRAVAAELARRGHRVIVIGRDTHRGAAVLAELEGANPGAGHRFIACDLSLLGAVATMAHEVARHVDRLDAVVLCAGVLSVLAEPTEEGLERTFALNYLSRYLLIRMVLPLLAAAPSGRVVLVANAGKYRDTLDLHDLAPDPNRGGLAISGRTQFANDLLAVELAERLRDTAIRVFCVYPGVVATGVFGNARGLPAGVPALAAVAHRLIGLSPEAAAYTPAALAADHDPGASGEFFGPHLRRRRIPARVRRPQRRAELWAASAQLTAAWLPATDIASTGKATS